MPDFAEGREVSEEAYEALSASFTCEEPTHNEHSVFCVWTRTVLERLTSAWPSNLYLIVLGTYLHCRETT
jgi:hypothetical protein